MGQLTSRGFPLMKAAHAALAGAAYRTSGYLACFARDVGFHGPILLNVSQAKSGSKFRKSARQQAAGISRTTSEIPGLPIVPSITTRAPCLEESRAILRLQQVVSRRSGGIRGSFRGDESRGESSLAPCKPDRAPTSAWRSRTAGHSLPGQRHRTPIRPQRPPR
jgi:hypothetical protein